MPARARSSRSRSAGNAITVQAATDDAGAITSTAAQVVAAINANTDAAKLATAALYRTNTGAGVVSATASTKLSDFLKRPDEPAARPDRGPGPADRQQRRQGAGLQGRRLHLLPGTRPGVGHAAGDAGDRRADAAQHAHRSGRPRRCSRRSTSSSSRRSTPDGANYSFNDFNFQRKNMVNHCTGDRPSDPADRTSWGVDLNRNYTVGSFFDGYVGASANCTCGTFAGPSELSEAESRNESVRPGQYPNIKFAMNVHSSGGYFMWPPGAYRADRTTLPYPPYGTLNYFEQTARRSVLERIYSDRKHGDPAGPDRPGHRRALLRRRQLGRPGVLQPRHHRLGLRDRRHEAPGGRHDRVPRLPAPVRRRADRRQRQASPTRATTRAWSSPTATTRSCSPRSTTPTTRRPRPRPRPAPRCPTLPWA